ncbi:MAG: Calx-beta domain-containing protein, partial [Kangiellaceae bacterium]|nr:Calx-beta domain-containing protein [Kangiellaceae bacterium]
SGSSVFEGNSGTANQLIFTIQRYGETNSALTVDYDIGGGTVDAADFDSTWPTSGTVSFAVGETSKQIALNVQGDLDIEADEFTYLTLSNAQSLTSGIQTQIVSGVASATIRNDDFPAQISVQSWTSVTEGDSVFDNTFLTFVVSRSGDLSSAVDVDYNFAGSGFDPIDADDLEGGMPQSGTVSFAAGQTTAPVSFAVAEDTEVESNEQGRITLSNARVVSGAPDATVQLLRAVGTGVINNDDQPPCIRVEVNGSSWGTSITEGNAGFQTVEFEIFREGDTTGTLEVDYSIFSNTSSVQGASNFDFLGNPIGSTGTVIFAAGETSKSVFVQVQGDRQIE